MNRPKVISEINSHHARKCVGPFRLRAVECDRLSKYIEHLESRQSVVTSSAVRAWCASLDPEERVLAGLGDDEAAAAIT